MKIGGSLAGVLLISGMAWGQEETEDPFGEPFTREMAAIEAAPETWAGERRVWLAFVIFSPSKE